MWLWLGVRLSVALRNRTGVLHSMCQAQFHEIIVPTIDTVRGNHSHAHAQFAQHAQEQGQRAALSPLAHAALCGRCATRRSWSCSWPTATTCSSLDPLAPVCLSLSLSLHASRRVHLPRAPPRRQVNHGAAQAPPRARPRALRAAHAGILRALQCQSDPGACGHEWGARDDGVCGKRRQREQSIGSCAPGACVGHHRRQVGAAARGRARPAAAQALRDLRG